MVVGRAFVGTSKAQSSISLTDILETGVVGYYTEERWSLASKNQEWVYFPRVRKKVALVES